MFFSSLSLSISKRSTLAKIRGFGGGRCCSSPGPSISTDLKNKVNKISIHLIRKKFPSFQSIYYLNTTKVSSQEKSRLPNWFTILKKYSRLQQLLESEDLYRLGKSLLLVNISSKLSNINDYFKIPNVYELSLLDFISYMFAFIALSKKKYVNQLGINKSKIKHCLIETNSFLISEFIWYVILIGWEETIECQS